MIFRTVRTDTDFAFFCQCADGEVLRDGDEAGRAVEPVQGPHRQEQHRHSLPGHLPRGCTRVPLEIESGSSLKQFTVKRG